MKVAITVMPLPIIKWPTNAVLTIIFIVGGLLFITALGMIIMQKDKHSIEKEDKKTMTSLLIVGIGCVVLSTGLNYSLLSHGMYNSKMPFEDSLKALFSTPVEDTIEVGNLENSVFVYYRFDCSDCHATYKDIQSAIKDQPIEIPWVSTRSEQGKKLLEKYPVMEVPAIVYVKNEDTFLWLPLAVKNDEGKIIFSQENFNNIIENIQ